MLELIIHVCLIGSDINCKEVRIPIMGGGTTRGCVMNAQLKLAKWVGKHPDWTIREWQCGVVFDQVTKIN